MKRLLSSRRADGAEFVRLCRRFISFISGATASASRRRGIAARRPALRFRFRCQWRRSRSLSDDREMCRRRKRRPRCRSRRPHRRRRRAAGPAVVASPPAVYSRPRRIRSRRAAAAVPPPSRRSPFRLPPLAAHRSRSRSSPSRRRRRSSGFRITPRKRLRIRRSATGRPKTRARSASRNAARRCAAIRSMTSNDKGEAVLINMKPKTDRQWTGAS